MSEPDWPEHDADMALIRRVNHLMRIAAGDGPADEAARAKAEAERLMPAYAEATSRYNAALRRALAARAADGGRESH